MRMQWMLASRETVGRLRAFAIDHQVLVIWLPILLVLAIQAVTRQTNPRMAGCVYCRRPRVTQWQGPLRARPLPLSAFFSVACRSVRCAANPGRAVGVVRGECRSAGGASIFCLGSGCWSALSRRWQFASVRVVCFSTRGAWQCALWLNSLAHQQTDIVIAALLTAGCFVMTRDRIISGAILIGLAAAFKGPPLLFCRLSCFSPPLVGRWCHYRGCAWSQSSAGFDRASGGRDLAWALGRANSVADNQCSSWNVECRSVQYFQSVAGRHASAFGDQHLVVQLRRPSCSRRATWSSSRQL